MRQTPLKIGNQNQMSHWLLNKILFINHLLLLHFSVSDHKKTIFKTLFFIIPSTLNQTFFSAISSKAIQTRMINLKIKMNKIILLIIKN